MLRFKDNIFILHGVFLLASIILRLLFLNAPQMPYPDAETYELFALQVADGLKITMPTRPLGYPLFITGIYELFGSSRQFVIFVQQALGVLSYLLYFSIFSRFFNKKWAAALFAFLAGSGSLFLVYERAVLSDFLNHFVLLAAVFIYFKYLDMKKAYLMAPLGVASFIAMTLRPNSAVFAAIVVFFLLVELAVMLKKKSPATTVKALAIFLAVVLVCNFSFKKFSEKAVGYAGEPVGVLGVSMLIRTADFVNYASPANREYKDRFRQFQNMYLQDYVPAYANFLAGYSLMTDIECAMPEETRRIYNDVAASAQSYYGAHRVGERYFSTNDILRELKCDMGTIDKAFLDISKEAIFSNPVAFSGAVVKNIMDFIESKQWEMTSFQKFGSEKDSPVLAGISQLYVSIDKVLGNAWVSRALTFIFIFGAIGFVMKRDKNLMPVAFLLCILAANYLVFGIIADHPAPRYKMTNYWIQFLLLFYFVGVLILRNKKKG